MLWWKVWTKNLQSCQYMYNQALLYLLFTALGKHSVSQFFQFFHPKRSYPYFVVRKSRVITLMDASPHSSPQLAPSPLSSQRSLCIVYRGTNIVLLLAMAASSISLAKLSSSRMQKVSLHAWCPAPGTAGDRPSIQQMSMDELRNEDFKIPWDGLLGVWCFGRLVSPGWRLMHAGGILLCFFHSP